MKTRTLLFTSLPLASLASSGCGAAASSSSTDTSWQPADDMNQQLVNQQQELLNQQTVNNQLQQDQTQQIPRASVHE